ncbi:hypothetical protein CGI24_23400 [Vibrio parahaemolyticus]|nr:hypothetical protein CGI24_23400 [Vibrio parahaemolyticus]
MVARCLATNKQFKSDSARLAFLVWVKFSVYGGQIEYRGCVLHTLIGRYIVPINSAIESFK